MTTAVIIGCRLPHGVVLEHPKDASKRITLKGIHASNVIGATHGTTVVPADFWEAWKAANAEFKPFKSGAIFAASNQNEAEAKAKDLKGKKTGLEPMDQNAMGVKPAEK